MCFQPSWLLTHHYWISTEGISKLKVSIPFCLHPTLLVYQETKLTTLGGWKELQRVDVISIKSLFSSKELKKKIISERSEWLSSLMLQTLSCFLPPESRDRAQNLSSSDQEREAVEDMKTILSHALGVKIELLLSVKRLKYHFFRPGALFDAGKMKVDQSQAGDIADLGQEVKICLLPALFTFPEASNRNGIGGESDLRQAIVRL